MDNSYFPILKQALSRGGQFADLFMEKRFSTRIVCEDNKIEQVVGGIDAGAGLRLVNDFKTAYAYTNEPTLSKLRDLARNLSNTVPNATNPAVFADTVKNSKKFFVSGKDRIEQIGIPEKVRFVHLANQTARAMDKRIVQVMVVYGDYLQEVTIINSDGGYYCDQRVGTMFATLVVAGADGLIQTGYEAVGGSVGLGLFNEGLVEEVAQKAVNRAILMLEAKDAPAGKMPVVFSSEAGGTMIHEAVGHGLEADLTQNNLSVYAGCLGKTVASAKVSVVDDTTLTRKRGTFRFDDEGTPAQRTVLVDKGILVGYLYDRITAMKENKTSTGNGRRESYHHCPIVRMTNTLIEPGQADPQSIIGSVNKGLLVKKMGGGQVNTVNGDFVFEVSEGYLIEKGEAIYPVRGATLIGSGPEVMKNIEAVGSDLGFAVGTCGKDGQGVPVSDAQPTLLIKEMTVGGTEV